MSTKAQGGGAWRVPHSGGLGQLLMLAGLTGFAISQPLLSVAGESPATFAFRSVEGFGLVLFALAVAFVPPVVLWLVLRVVALIDERISDVVFLVFAAALGLIAGIQVAKALDIERSFLIALAGIAVAGALVVAYLRLRSVDLWLRYTAILPVAAVLLFLFASPTSALLRPGGSEVEQVSASGSPPVVFIMLDEFPTIDLLDEDRGIDAERFPNLASLTEDFTWYRDYTVPANETLLSIPSILTGKLPSDVPTVAANHPDSLFSLLAPTHDLHVFESATKLCGLEACTSVQDTRASTGLLGALGEMADVWAQRVSLGPTQAPDLGEFEEEVVEDEVSSAPAGEEANPMDRLSSDIASMPTRAVDFTASFTEPSDRPGLYFLHLLMPHQPWTFYPDGTRYDGSRVNLDNAEWPRTLVAQRHLLQAQYADRLVGEMIDSLRASGIYEESMVIVTADHGISFDGVPDGRNLTDARIPEVAYAPLFIKYPGEGAGTVSDVNVTGTDLLPTIADVTGTTPSWPVTGASARSEAVTNRGPEKVIYNFRDGKDRHPRQEMDFDASRRPEASDRLVAPLAPGGNMLAGLVDGLGVADLLGTSIDDLGASRGTGSATFARQRETESGLEPGTARADLVDDALAPGDVAVVAVDGTIVTAAPVVDGRIDLLWPAAGIAEDRSKVRVVVVSGAERRELEVS